MTTTISRSLAQGALINEAEDAVFYKVASTLIDPENNSGEGYRVPLNSDGSIHTVSTSLTVQPTEDTRCMVVTSQLRRAVSCDQPCVTIYWLKKTPDSDRIPPVIETDNIIKTQTLDTRLPIDRFISMLPISEKCNVIETTPDITRQGAATVICTDFGQSQVTGFPLASAANFAKDDEYITNLDSHGGVTYIARYPESFKGDPHVTSYTPGKNRKVKWPSAGLGAEEFQKKYDGSITLGIGDNEGIEYYGSEDPECLGITTEGMRKRQLGTQGSMMNVTVAPQYGATTAEPVTLWDTSSKGEMLYAPIGQSNVAIFNRDASTATVDFSFKMQAAPQYYDALTGKNFCNELGLTSFAVNPELDSLTPGSSSWQTNYKLPAECYAGQDCKLMLFRLEALGDNYAPASGQTVGGERVIGCSRFCVRYGMTTDVAPKIFYDTEGDNEIYNNTLSSQGFTVDANSRTIKINQWHVRAGIGNDEWYLNKQPQVPSKFAGDEVILRLRITVVPVDNVPWMSSSYTHQPWTCYAKGGQALQATYIDPNSHTAGQPGWKSGANGYFVTNSGFNKFLQGQADAEDQRAVVGLNISQNGGASAILGPPTGGTAFKALKDQGGILPGQILDDTSTPSVSNNPCVRQAIVRTRHRVAGLTERECVYASNAGFVTATQTFDNTEAGWGETITGVINSGPICFSAPSAPANASVVNFCYLTYRDPNTYDTWSGLDFEDDICLAYGLVKVSATPLPAGSQTYPIQSIVWGGNASAVPGPQGVKCDWLTEEPFAGKDGKGFETVPYIVFCRGSPSGVTISFQDQIKPVMPSIGLGSMNLRYCAAALQFEPLSVELADPGFGYKSTDNVASWTAPPLRPAWMGTGVEGTIIPGAVPPKNNPKFIVSELPFDSNMFSCETNVSNVQLCSPFANSMHMKRGVIMINNIQPPTGGLTSTSIRVSYWAAVFCQQRNVNRPYIQPPHGVSISGNMKHAIALQLMAEFLPNVYANTKMVTLGNALMHAVDVPGQALQAWSFGGWFKNAARSVGRWVKTAYTTGKEAFQNLDPAIIEAAKLAMRSKEARALKRRAMEKAGITPADEAKAIQIAKTAHKMAKAGGLISGSNAPLGADTMGDINSVINTVGNVAKAIGPLLPFLLAGSNAPLGSGSNAPLGGGLYAYSGDNVGTATFPAVDLSDGEPKYEKSFKLMVSNHRKTGTSYKRLTINGNRIYTDARLVDMSNPSGAVLQALNEYTKSNPGTSYISLAGKDKRKIEGGSFEAALASALKGEEGRHVTGRITSFRGGKAQIGGVLGVDAKAKANPDLEIPASNAGDAVGNKIVREI